LSYALWQSRFGADRRAIGQTIRLDGQTVTIVGVLPQDFRWVQELRWVEKCDVMEPMGVWATHNDSATDRGDRGDLLVVGRLAAGVRMEQGRAEMEIISARRACGHLQGQ